MSQSVKHLDASASGLLLLHGCTQDMFDSIVQATLSTPSYVKRLGITWLGFFTLIGGPIAYQTFEPSAQVHQLACCFFLCQTIDEGASAWYCQQLPTEETHWFAQPIEFVVSAAIGALLVVAVAVLRIYLGWAYVGDRLLSAAVGDVCPCTRWDTVLAS